MGAFQPIFRDHYVKDKAPQEVWVHGPAHEAIRRRYIEARYRLMPYLYAVAEENSRTGLPIVRPVFLEYPAVVGKGDHVGGTEAQFLLGRDLLIAPPTTWESPAPWTVSLPGIGWYDYWTGIRISAASTTETPRLDRLPVFVRPGAILPRQPLVQSTAETPNGNLELAVYPGADCTGTIYLDDGVSLRYRRGDYLRQRVRCDATGLTFGAREGRYAPWWRAIDVTIHGWAGPAPRVAVAGRAIPARLDPATARCGSRSRIARARPRSRWIAGNLRPDIGVDQPDPRGADRRDRDVARSCGHQECLRIGKARAPPPGGDLDPRALDDAHDAALAIGCDAHRPVETVALDIVEVVGVRRKMLAQIAFGLPGKDRPRDQAVLHVCARAIEAQVGDATINVERARVAFEIEAQPVVELEGVDIRRGADFEHEVARTGAWIVPAGIRNRSCRAAGNCCTWRATSTAVPRVALSRSAVSNASASMSARKPA